MGLASPEGDMADDAAMGLCHTKERSRCDRIVRNADGIGIEGKSPCPGLRKDVEKGGTETLVMLPLRVGWKMVPVRGPVADQFAILCDGGSRKMSDPCIDPPDRIRDIRAISWGLVADKKIFRNIFINPFSEPILFFNRPSVEADCPDLIRGFIQGLARARR